MSDFTCFKNKLISGLKIKIKNYETKIENHFIQRQVASVNGFTDKYVRTVLGQWLLRKISPYPKPNSNSDHGSIFLGDNFLDTVWTTVELVSLVGKNNKIGNYIHKHNGRPFREGKKIYKVIKL